ncbi:hypothetical protein QR680_002301 [Steinernema hermaphroditum]|uniref:Ephrin RBD domain-containing protein n=1 Tax=Steinernema hermaphroditum TaxID=289476 RepID=A0AA39LHG6_9BILA|nr:hypothetical protein QR680_002301 [Steinernema hermaphroditum]
MTTDAAEIDIPFVGRSCTCCLRMAMMMLSFPQHIMRNPDSEIAACGLVMRFLFMVTVVTSYWTILFALRSSVPATTTIFHLNWSSSNPMFAFSSDNGAIPAGRIGVGDVLVFDCPFTDHEKNQTKEEYSAIYDVTEEEMHDCVLRDDSKLVGECVEPFRQRTIVYRRGDFSKKLHFMSVSSGTKDGLYNRVGGLCENANLRATVYLDETQNRKIEDYLDADVHFLDLRPPREEVDTDDDDYDFVGDYDGMNEEQIIRAHRINHIQRVGKVIDIGRYEGPHMTKEQWRNAFAKSYQVDQPLTAEDLDPMVRSKFRFFSTKKPMEAEVKPTKKSKSRLPLLPDVPYFRNRLRGRPTFS